ncbi:MAG TPA: hydroxymethylbilane synthase [Gemmataceae bacterium]|jgi:hydroxymethylbilane synthase|nr:hydroxymethylbilane synthase [Gemmataceae bacterium]
MNPFRLGTRGSRLALWQANYVADRLQPLAAPRVVELVEIVTAGDQVRDVPLPALGGEGVFTKEIQRALLAGEVDVAVHSLKDLPTVPVEGLLLAAVPPRGPVGDVLVSHRHRTFDGLPRGAIVATGSLRRRAQALYRRPDLRLVHIRGNVETRLRKLQEQDLDALILAEAGLERLGLGHAVTEVLDRSWMLPAVGQGALGLECRQDDRVALDLLAEVDDVSTRQAVLAERELLRSLGGGCQVPIGADSVIAGETLHLRGTVLTPDGTRRTEAAEAGPLADAEAVGRRLAQELLRRGAADILGIRH